MQKLLSGDSILSKNNIINTFFIILFASLLIVFKYASTADWSIHDWNGIISWATSENLDIDRRIGSFYKSFGIFFLSFSIILLLLNKVKKVLAESELNLLNNLSLAGCMLLFFKLIGADVHASLLLILILQLLVVVYALADFFLSGRKRKQSFSVPEAAWCVAMGMSAFFLIQGFVDISAYYNQCLFLLSAGAMHFCFWTERKNNSIPFYEWMISLRFVALTPLWVVVSIELYMILNQHNVFSITPIAILVLLLILTALVIIKSSKKPRSLDTLEKDALRSISNFYFPWLLIGLIAFSYYKPVAEVSAEMFEQANPALSIQQYFEFGKLPWLQTFSSHSGADWITGFIYSLLNGFSGLSYHCYDFLIIVLYIVLMYYALKNITNAYAAILSVLLFPYVNLLLPQFHFMMLLPLLILATTLKAPTFKNYFFLFSCLILMPLWRYDLAYGNILSLLGCLTLFFFLRKDLRSSLPALRKGFLFALIVPVILFIAALMLSHRSLLTTMKDALAYLGTPQAFGTKDLANEKTLVYYALYFIFPVAVGICFFYVLSRLWLSKDSAEKPGFSLVTVLFLSIYYIANFHRGLIRHNLSEGWDTAFTSFAFLIIIITVHHFLRSKNQTLRVAATLAFATLLLAQFKYPKPDLDKNNYYKEINAAVCSPLQLKFEKKKIDRGSLSDSNSKELYTDLKDFLDKNIPADATFLDFSNTPMLYFYTHRQSPNYFNQIPHTALNVYLQERFLEELKNYKVPVVLFSNYPYQWWDSFDGIPNTYRHYLIAEYIYKHYQPYAIINKHTVWIENGHKLLSDSTNFYVRDTVSVQPRAYELKYLPYIMGKSFPILINDSSLFNVHFDYDDTIGETDSTGIGFGWTFDKDPFSTDTSFLDNKKVNYIMLKVKNLTGQRNSFKLGLCNGDKDGSSFTFFLKEDNNEHAYLVRTASDYGYYTGNASPCDFSSKGKCVITKIEFIYSKL